MRFLSTSDLNHCLDLDLLREAMKETLVNLSKGRGKSFPRMVVRLAGNRAMGFMPAEQTEGAALGYKIVAVFPDDAEIGLNPHQGIVALLHPKTGQVTCILDGSEVTALRTAAVSAAATHKLARPDARTLGLIGAGRQAYEHVRAFLRLYSFETVLVFSPRSASALAVRIENEFSLKTQIFQTPQAVASRADILVTATSSASPLLSILDVRRGAHVCAIGACRPGMREIGLRSRPGLKIYLDSQDACQLEAEEIAGDPRIQDHIIGEIGHCLDDQIESRQTDSEITFFKSVGLGIEDLGAARFFHDRAIQLGVGRDF